MNGERVSHLGSLHRMTQHQEVKGGEMERMHGGDGGGACRKGKDGRRGKQKKWNKERYKNKQFVG